MKTITSSMVRTWKSCRKLFYFQYVEQLKPYKTPQALAIGSNYHNLVESIVKGKKVDCEPNIAQIMASQFENKILPNLPTISEVEREFCIPIADDLGLIGKIDAITSDGVPVEHKTTSSKIDEKYIDQLRWDDQVTNYLLALSLERGELVKECIYTVVQKPTIRQKNNEELDEYYERCIEWYGDDDTKCNTFKVTRSKDELAEKQDELEYIGREIERCEKYYRNPNKCMFLGCEFKSICLDYEPGVETIDFEKKQKRNEELEGDYYE